MSKLLDQECELRLDDAQDRRRCLTAGTRNQLLALERRCARGCLVQPCGGLFARQEYWSGLSPSERQRHMLRALLGEHPEWVFCQVSAATVYGLAVPARLLDTVHVATGVPARARQTGLVQRHYLVVDATCAVDGIAVTTIDRTTFDCGRTLPFADALAIADSSIRMGLTTREEMASFAEAAPRCKGIPDARIVARFADGRSESAGESLARAAMIELGFALPSLQQNFVDPVDGTTSRVDFLWTLPNGSQVVGEFDGREKYVDPSMQKGGDLVDTLLAERRRESRVSASVSRVVRFSYADVMNRAYFARLLDAFGVPRTRSASGPRLHR